MSQGTLQVANQGFPGFRTDLNAALAAVNSLNSGTAAPSVLAAGQRWLDLSGGTRPVVKQSDGSDWISVTQFDTGGNVSRPFVGTGILGLHPFLPQSGTAPDIGATGNLHGTAYLTAINLGNEAMTEYDKGTFTPVIRGSSTAGTQTYSTQRGQYIRIGDMVWCWIKLIMSLKDVATAGDLQIAGLPFTSANISDYGGAFNVGLWQNIDLNTGAGYYSLGGFVEQNSTVISLFENGDNNAVSALTAADLAATSLIYGSLIYEAA